MGTTNYNESIKEMKAYDIIGIAASAGGLKAISAVLSSLPMGFSTPIVIVQHLDPHYRSMLAEILSRKTHLSVTQAKDGENIRPNHIFIAPPNKHLEVTPEGTLSLTSTQVVQHVRPSADILFKSLAEIYKNRVIAVVLTGTGQDGQDGVRAIDRQGGIVIAQDKSTSEFFGMPDKAIQTGCVDYILPLSEIAAKLDELVNFEEAS
jgi:two-component system chemotaxis response regulator CheB